MGHGFHKQKSERGGASIGAPAGSGLLAACCAVATVIACQPEPPLAPPRLAVRVQQLLEDPSLAPSTVLPEAVSPAAAASPTDAATPTDAAAAPTPIAAAAATPTQVAEAPPKAAEPAAAPSDAGEEPSQPDHKKRRGDGDHDTASGRTAKEGRAGKDAKEGKETKDGKDGKESKDGGKQGSGKDPMGGEVVVPDGADATDLYYSGKRKLDHGDFAGAIADLRASHQVRASVRTLTLLGRAYFDSDQIAAAEKVLKAAGTYDEAMLLLGQLYQQSGKSAKARAIYEKFLQVHADHAKAEWVRKLLQTL